jgi:hypothetical protein
MVFGITHNFHSSPAGQHFIALGNGPDGVVCAFGVNVRANFLDERAYIQLGKDHNRVYVGQRSQNFGALLCRHQRTALAFQSAHRGVGVYGHDQSPTQPLGSLQVAHVSNVEQIETAIGECDGIARAPPFRHLLSQLFAIKNLVCDGFSPEFFPESML